MWWFLQSRSKALHPQADVNLSNPPVRARNANEAEILALVPDMAAWTEHGVALKVWLPESAARLLRHVALFEGCSQSSWVRECLFEYVYGRAAVIAYRLRQRERSATQTMFSRARVDRTQGRYIYKVPQLGKDIVAFKVWVSEPLKADLEVLARHANIQLSPFVREAVLGGLYGRGTLPERPQAPPVATDWEQGRDVPLASVEEADHHDMGWADRQWVPVGTATGEAREP